ncbi:MAG: ATP-binding cassette domain-containing protein [Bacteroidaceae bacterium]|nr:ATP-binding cassette domain-containing protein [Bacteroidaceae bacterium]
MREVIRIDKGVTRHPEHRMAEPVSLSIYEGEQIAIVGENGSGKSRLVDILISRFPLLLNEVKYDFTPSPYQLVSENIRYITFRDSYGTNDSNYYYQLRWNQHEIGENIPTAVSFLENAPKKLIEMFHLEPVLNKPVITLSSGEMRKFQLTRALTTMPRVLVMDNPFIGLDAQTRSQLAELMQTLIQETGLLLILVLSKTDDLPEFITHVLPVENLTLKEKVTREEYMQARQAIQTPVLPQLERDWIINLKEKDISQIPFYPQRGGEILRFNDVSIRYGERIILSHLNWVVCEGERWALSGENGAGKSTLLSLVCADNPQAYACDIHLFGHRRGTGESIWEIKKHIGYVSPEMHRSYLKDIPAIDIVASGLNDSIGLYTRPKTEQREICLRWMQVFGIRDLAERTFLKLSSGEQRLCLLARAFVKDPELLILDEPLHGLDNRNRQRVREVIEAFCSRKNKTLIMVTHYAEELPTCIKKELYLTKNI